MPRHSETPQGIYCHGYRCTFQTEDAAANDDCCPWCDEEVAL